MVATVWVKCDIKVINENTMKWEKIDSVIDTPKEIEKAKKKLKNKGYKNLWCFHVWGKEALF